MELTLFLVYFTLFLLKSGAVSAYQVEYGTLGGSVNFHESVPVQANPAITWNFQNAIIAQRFPGLTPVCVGDQYTGRCTLSEDGTLRLESLKLADEGEYTMTSQYPNNTLIKRSTYVLKVYTVLNAPVLSTNDTSNNLIGGTYVSLHCNAGGQTVTTYTFDRDGNNICSEPHVICRNSYLYFQPIKGSDSGHYTCTIQNPVSSNSSGNSIQLSVSDPISDVKLTTNVSGLLWPGIDAVSLICSAHGTNIIYSWSLRGSPLPQNPQYNLTQSNSVLIINPVSKNYTGTFTCTASNWINNQTSNGVNLNLASAVTSVTLTSNATGLVWSGDESVSLRCSAQGSEVSFSWRLNGKPLPQDSRYHITPGDSPSYSNLIISPVSRNDEGPFTCTASNKLNSLSSSGLTLSLTWPPEGHVACLVDTGNENVHLTCSWPRGQPAANVTMVFQGVSESEPNQVSRILSINTSIEDSTMMCFGDQLGRLSNCELKFEPPQSPGHNNNTITSVTDGQGAVMAVVLVPVLQAEFSWYHLTPELIPLQDTSKFTVISNSFKSSLLIAAVTKEDAGKYECRAKNIVGTQSFIFTVDVTSSTCHGLGGGEVAGIVIGVVAGIAIIEVTVFLVLKSKKKTPSGTVYENTNVSPTHIYSTTIPGTEMKSGQQESNYEQLIHMDRALYSHLQPSTVK